MKDRETVILLHGILNPCVIMIPAARRLRKEGYQTFVWGYPGSRNTVEAHAASLRKFVESIPGDRPIHFVGFSLGAIVIRYMLTNLPIPRAGRFVMIGPPNHGCAMAEELSAKPWFPWIYGNKSIRQLFPSAAAFRKVCGIPPVEFGIIAGGTGDARGFAQGWGEDNDSTVTVASTRLSGAKDFVVLPYWHMPLVWARPTLDRVVHFLREGTFQ
jgi:pimeloyl-ACP methyl ester carboxylesterase